MLELTKYNDYVSTYKQYYNDDNYQKSMLNDRGKVITAAGWGIKTTALRKKIASDKK